MAGNWNSLELVRESTCSLGNREEIWYFNRIRFADRISHPCGKDCRGMDPVWKV